MSDEALREEVQALRERLAQLEVDRAKPVKVDVEGFEGLRDLSRAIETKNLDAFMLDRGVPDKWFWTPIVVGGVATVGLIIAEYVNYYLFRFF